MQRLMVPSLSLLPPAAPVLTRVQTNQARRLLLVPLQLH